VLKAYSRYGARVLPDTEQIIAECRRRGELIQGPALRRFEAAFAAYCGGGTAVTASYGRMAFFYLLNALGLPPGAEIVFPALTFWVVPEIARVAGYTPVFADVDPETFCLDPAAFERAVTEHTRAVVPTHLYGLPCDMDAIMRVADRHNLKVIEDCAHALGATYRGRHVGTFGHAGFFSFQTLKPLNTYGGGIALMADPVLAAAVRSQAEAEPWPSEDEIRKKLLLGKAERVFIRPRVFTFSLFPILWVASWFRARPDVYLWESIRPLNPLPPSYRRRYTNVQAAIGLAGLEQHLATWTATSRAHARLLDSALEPLPGVHLPARPADREHVYYQYCFYAPDRDEAVRRAIRRGVDIETLHVDVCTDLDLFGRPQGAPGARRAADALQLPAYATLEPAEVETVARRIARVLADPARAATAPRRAVP
jgi:dTDP-4-amino-4,6-dideoxygalactose transaminase